MLQHRAFIITLPKKFTLWRAALVLCIQNCAILCAKERSNAKQLPYTVHFSLSTLDKAVWGEVKFSLMTAGKSVMLKVAPWRDEKNDEGDNFRGCWSQVDVCSGCSTVLVLTSVAACRMPSSAQQQIRHFSTTLAPQYTDANKTSHYRYVEHMAS